MKKNNIKKQSGSMAVYVAIVLTTFMLILSTLYFSMIAVRKSQLGTNLKIKQSYEIDNNKVSEIYEAQEAKLGPSQKEFVFSYKGSAETFTAPTTGRYKLEVWGAQGGSYSNTYIGGKGGYSTGIISLTKGTQMSVYVGGQPTAYNKTATSNNTNAGGYNGGGAGRTYRYSSTYTYGMGGGGATDIRIGGTTLYYRVIVAGGGSGSTNGSNGYAGGGTQGLGYSSTYYGTQKTAGGGGSFGTGGASAGKYNYRYGSSGGGGGWYGGGALTGQSNSSSVYRQYSGGGSGFVWTSGTASNAPSGYSVATSYYLTDASTTDGTKNIPTTSGTGTEPGHSGNGYAKITWVGR